MKIDDKEKLMNPIKSTKNYVIKKQNTKKINENWKND